MVKQGLGLDLTELRLGPPGGAQVEKNEKKRRVSGGEMKNDEVAVGWPPVCSYRRKKCFNGGRGETRKAKANHHYVKVSADGAPFLRKIDLSNHKGYCDLAMALGKLFGCHGIEKALRDEGDSSEYVAIYEDKDGDWMLVEDDVPWQMFSESCRRLRIMKRSGAKGKALAFAKGASKDGYIWI
ncbi:auxin-induced protein AUX22-like [Diospyros lotus]|uniref:auxin-induced protein AUX22-like n=1 Tax=Diospyros lotus TaxID=55363 RepID=UPI0022517DE4|nr:auxin-induced protein AUX22-like [Diospyros lotus]